MAVGSAMEGLRPVAEFQYSDFMSSGFDEITTVLGALPLPDAACACPWCCARPSGGGVRASNFHSINPEPWFAHAPGLKVVCPAFPADAKGLLKSAIRDDNPCMFLEHKWIYRRIKEHVPEDPDFLVPIGKADVKREGTDVSDRHVRRHGAQGARGRREPGRPRACRSRSSTCAAIVPMDEETVLRSIAKTSRALVLYESYRFLGIGAEVAAMIAEKAFEHLDAPVDAPGAAEHARAVLSPLEDAFLPQVADIEAAVERLSAW